MTMEARCSLYEIHLLCSARRTLTRDIVQEAPGTGGLGEPLNAIISGNSDKDVLVDQATDGGLRNYFQ